MFTGSYYQSAYPSMAGLYAFKAVLAAGKCVEVCTFAKNCAALNTKVTKLEKAFGSTFLLAITWYLFKNHKTSD